MEQNDDEPDEIPTRMRRAASVGARQVESTIQERSGQPLTPQASLRKKTLRSIPTSPALAAALTSRGVSFSTTAAQARPRSFSSADSALPRNQWRQSQQAASPRGPLRSRLGSDRKSALQQTNESQTNFAAGTSASVEGPRLGKASSGEVGAVAM